MRYVLKSMVMAGVLAAALAAQVPAPDFVLYPSVSSPVSFDLTFAVSGPPTSTFAVLFTFDDPFSTPPEQIIIYPLVSGQIGASGQSSTTYSIPSWQGPLPDVWFGTIVYTPSGNVAIPAIFKLGGNFLVNAGAGLTSRVYARNVGTGDVRMDGKTTLGGTVSMWDAPQPCPNLNGPFNVAAPAVQFVDSMVIPATGCFSLTGNVPAGRCIVLMVGGVVIATVDT